MQAAKKKLNNGTKKAAESQRLIDRRELAQKIPLSYSKIWDLMRRGLFPRSRVIGDRALWLESEIDAYIRELPIKPIKGDHL